VSCVSRLRRDLSRTVKQAQTDQAKAPHGPLTTEEHQELAKLRQDNIHKQSRNRYGAPRIHAALKHKGFEVGRHRVARLMAKLGICVRPFLGCPQGYNGNSKARLTRITRFRLPRMC
jgi:transposase InsO family protein